MKSFISQVLNIHYLINEHGLILLLLSCVFSTSHSHIAASSSISSRLDNFLLLFFCHYCFGIFLGVGAGTLLLLPSSSHYVVESCIQKEEKNREREEKKRKREKRIDKTARLRWRRLKSTKEYWSSVDERWDKRERERKRMSFCFPLIFSMLIRRIKIP